MPTIRDPGQRNTESKELKGDEEKELYASIDRAFEDTRTLDTRVLYEKVKKYEGELLSTAEMAKGQFNKDFGGLSPSSGEFGIDFIHPGYFGWDTWDNLGSVSKGSVTTWLDADTPDNLNSGVGGQEDPLTVGEPVTHVILGIGSYSPSPKTSRVSLRLNDSPQAAITTEDAFRNTDVRIKWLRSPIVLNEEDNLYAELYANADGQAAPYFYGFSFIEEKEYRNIDPAQMAGTDSNYIVVE